MSLLFQGRVTPLRRGALVVCEPNCYLGPENAPLGRVVGDPNRMVPLPQGTIAEYLWHERKQTRIYIRVLGELELLATMHRRSGTSLPDMLKESTTPVLCVYAQHWSRYVLETRNVNLRNNLYGTE